MRWVRVQCHDHEVLEQALLSRHAVRRVAGPGKIGVLSRAVQELTASWLQMGSARRFAFAVELLRRSGHSVISSIDDGASLVCYRLLPHSGMATAAQAVAWFAFC